MVLCVTFQCVWDTYIFPMQVINYYGVSGITHHSCCPLFWHVWNIYSILYMLSMCIVCMENMHIPYMLSIVLVCMDWYICPMHATNWHCMCVWNNIFSMHANIVTTTTLCMEYVPYMLWTVKLWMDIRVYIYHTCCYLLAGDAQVLEDWTIDCSQHLSFFVFCPGLVCHACGCALFYPPLKLGGVVRARQELTPQICTFYIVGLSH